MTSSAKMSGGAIRAFCAVVVATLAFIMSNPVVAESRFSPFTTTDRSQGCSIVYNGRFKNYTDPVSFQYTRADGGSVTSKQFHDLLDRASGFDEWRGGYAKLSSGQYVGYYDVNGVKHCNEMEEGNATGCEICDRYHVRLGKGGPTRYGLTSVVGTPHKEHWCYKKLTHEVTSFTQARDKMVSYFKVPVYRRSKFYLGNTQTREFPHCVHKTVGSDGYVVRVTR